MKKNFESDQPCIICKREGKGLVTFHHIYTRKAHPDCIEKEWNKISACQRCHNWFHDKGAVGMASLYPQVKRWLLENGWEKCKLTAKWRHE